MFRKWHFARDPLEPEKLKWAREERGLYVNGRGDVKEERERGGKEGGGWGRGRGGRGVVRTKELSAEPLLCP